MDERTLLARALDAQGPPPAAPDDFADRVLRAMDPPRRRPLRALSLGAVAVAAGAVMAFGSPWAREGSVSVVGASRAVSLGRRAVAVAEPGTSLRYRVGGWLRGDRVELSAGSAFFRVDHGRGFEVVTPHGTVTVTGTCFRVSARATVEGKQEGASMRSGWFAGGVATALLAVQVYEGGVRVARAGDPQHAVALRAGQQARVDEGGRLRVGDPAGPEGDGAPSVAAATAPTGSAPPAARDEAAQAEIVRLRTILARNGISAETGARDGGTAPRGLDDPGDTNLTDDEWRTLAQRGEMRFRLPASSRREGLDEARARALNIPEQDRSEVNEVFRTAQAELQRQLGALYREASGAAPGTMSIDALMNEIRDKTPDEVVSDTIWRLAQERGGLMPARDPSPEQTPYERAMRALTGYERDLERRLVPVVGERIAHDMLFGERAIPGHSFGMAARRASP